MENSVSIEDHAIPSPLKEENFLIDESERREIEDLIGYKFCNPALLQQAFTHETCEKEPSKSYKRLEFMGDAVLGLLVATKHFFDYPDHLPGKLTPLRSSNVDTEKLARASVKWSLHKNLRHKKPLLDGQIEDFLKGIEENPTYSAGLIQSPKNLGDVFKSLVGAIYIDSQCSLPITQKVVLRLLEPMVTSETFRPHPITRIHELCQKHGLKLKFEERKLPETGEVEVHVFVDDECIFEETYVSKKVIPSNKAANDAYEKVVSKVQELVMMGDVEDHMIPSPLEEEREKFLIDESERGEIEDLIGYKFSNPSLLQEAFTHRTCVEEPSKSYERLEYMGDAVLGLLVATKHFFDYPDYLPGKLTRLRSSNVDTEKLARASVKWSLHNHLRHKKPLLDGQIDDFLKEIEVYHPTYSAGLVQSPKNLADVFESLVGAIYIDNQCSLPITQKVVLRLLEPMVTSETFRPHPVTRIHELCQKRGLKLKFEERKLPETGEVEVHVFVDDECILEGTYVIKRVIASNKAANDAYEKIASKVQELVMDDIVPA